MADYRDESESLRAKVSELEVQLAASEREIARLRGEDARAAGAGVGPVDGVVGEPLHFVGERELAFEVGPAGYEAIAALVRERTGGQVSQVGRTLTGPGLSLTSADGWTRVRLETDLRAMRRSVFLMPFLAGTLGGLPMLGIFLDLAQHTAISPWNAAWAIPAMVLGAGAGMRRLVARHARQGHTKHAALLEAIVSLAEKHRVAPPPDRVRVEAIVEHAEHGTHVASEQEDTEQADTEQADTEQADTEQVGAEREGSLGR